MHTLGTSKGALNLFMAHMPGQLSGPAWGRLCPSCLIEMHLPEGEVTAGQRPMPWEAQAGARMGAQCPSCVRWSLWVPGARTCSPRGYIGAPMPGLPPQAGGGLWACRCVYEGMGVTYIPCTVFFKAPRGPPPQAVAGGFPWRWSPAPSAGRDGGSQEESLPQPNGLFR